eukprot:1108068-Pelagomonas_calceolata.AAC.8
MSNMVARNEPGIISAVVRSQSLNWTPSTRPKLFTRSTSARPFSPTLHLLVNICAVEPQVAAPKVDVSTPPRELCLLLWLGCFVKCRPVNCLHDISPPLYSQQGL